MPVPRVFISYSHDSELHSKRVLALANELRGSGIETQIDQYVGDPDEGWPMWMRNQVLEADRVLLVFTETYARRFLGKEEEGRGLGVTFEGVVATQALYESGARNAKFRPVVFAKEDEKFIPLELRRFNRYRVDTPEHYQNLLYWLHKAPRIVAPPIGQPRDLQPEPAPELFPSRPDESRGPEGQAISRLVTLDIIPAVGKLIGRREYIKKIKAFLADSTCRLAIMQGFPGIGKTVLGARLAEMFESPQAVLWAHCVADQALGDLLFGRLNAFFEAQGETSLRAVWGDPDPAHLQIKIDHLIRALAKRKYLLIFDEFENWLTPDLGWKNDQLRRTFATVLRSTHCSKIVFISSQTTLFDPVSDRLPHGITLEQTVLGLTEAESVRLLRATGLRKDEGLLRRIAGHCEGNPYLLQVVSHQILHLHREPEELFKSGSRFSDLLNIAVRDLCPKARIELDRISVFRRMLSFQDLRKLGTDLGVVGALVGRFLLTENRTNDTVSIANVVRNWVLAVMPEDRRRALHLQAAGFYATQNTSTPTTYEEMQPWLEEIYHRFEGVDFDGAGRAISKIAQLLIDWGYVDYAEQNISRLLNVTNELSIKAQSSFWLGSIQDLRANAGSAHKFFEEALELFGQINDYAGMAECNFRIGRTHNAAHRFAEAKAYFNRCIGICMAHGVTNGWAASLLAMGWSLQEQSVQIGDIQTEDILALYRDALTQAKATDDFETLSSAHRHIGFLLWTKQRHRHGAAEHLEQARTISEQHNLMKELGAVCAELGYLYCEWGDSEKAEQNCDRAIEIWSRLGNLYGLGSALCNMGAIRELQGNLEKAIEFYAKSRDTFSEVLIPGGEAYPALCLGRALLKMGRLTEARCNFSEALRLATENGLKETAANARDELAKVSPSA